ncbi:Uncharacterized protein OBRU01_00791, partial [Operophtera brumata]
CKPDWCFPSTSKETNELLRQCADLPTFRPSGDRNIASTYPLIHERVLLLMTHFLIYKSIEKSFYKDMTVPEFIDRILQKRAVAFLEATDSYDEMKLSAMVYVSGRTACINDGRRHNSGEIQEKGVQDNAIIIDSQNCCENGYGEEVTPTTCLNVLKTTYDKCDERRYTDRFVNVMHKGAIFDNEAYYKRLSIIAESVLLEAESRAVEDGKNAFVNIIGAGLGVWKISPHQNDVFLLTFLERTRALLRRGALSHVTDVNFAYIRPSDSIRGGINVQLKNREPSSRLTGEHEGKLLVMTYPWDGNAHPGNEFWSVAELHNAHVNPAASARHARVATLGAGVTRIADYCKSSVQPVD